jgi:hypothetical protein
VESQCDHINMSLCKVAVEDHKSQSGRARVEGGEFGLAQLYRAVAGGRMGDVELGSVVGGCRAIPATFAISQWPDRHKSVLNPFTSIYFSVNNIRPPSCDLWQTAALLSPRTHARTHAHTHTHLRETTC